MQSKKLDEELHKPIFKKIKKKTVHLSYVDHILDPDLADMQLISKVNKGS